MDSPASTCVLSLSDASVSDLGNDVTSPAIVAANPESEISAPPECEGAPLFEPGDGDMKISVNGTCFEAHKYLIKRFRGLKLLLDKQSSEINIHREDISAGDFREMFKVLYASIVTGPFAFTSQTLVSALRIATIYEYQVLRDYCIKFLETLKLDAVKRIEIAHEFHLSAWEELAYHELGMRDEPITREEAEIIGLDAFVCIAEMREKEQRRRGKEIDAVGVAQDTQSQVPASPARKALTQGGTIGDRLHEDAPRVATLCAQPSPAGGKQETNGAVTRVNNSGIQINTPPVQSDLGGLYDTQNRSDDHVEMPDCKCRMGSGQNGETADKKCVVLPCALSTFETIQTQQLAHTNRISNLELTVKKFGAPTPSTPAPLQRQIQPSAQALAALKHADLRLTTPKKDPVQEPQRSDSNCSGRPLTLGHTTMLNPWDLLAGSDFAQKKP